MSASRKPRRTRKSIRWPGWNYSQAGFYFVTICTHQRQHFFEIGHIRESVENSWEQIPQYTSGQFVELDEYVVMPNHMHGILVMKPGFSETRTAETRATLLGNTIGTFKSLVTKRVRILLKIGDVPLPIWQRGYYDRVIRNEREYHAIQQYIRDNPKRWAEDRDNLDQLITKMTKKS